MMIPSSGMGALLRFLEVKHPTLKQDVRIEGYEEGRLAGGLIVMSQLSPYALFFHPDTMELTHFSPHITFDIYCKHQIPYPADDVKPIRSRMILSTPEERLDFLRKFFEMKDAGEAIQFWYHAQMKSRTMLNHKS